MLWNTLRPMARGHLRQNANTWLHLALELLVSMFALLEYLAVDLSEIFWSAGYNQINWMKKSEVTMNALSVWDETNRRISRCQAS